MTPRWNNHKKTCYISKSTNYLPPILETASRMIDTFTPLYKASIQQDTQLLSERMIPTFTDDTKKSDHDSLHHVLFSVNQFQINITQLKSNAVKNYCSDYKLFHSAQTEDESLTSNPDTLEMNQFTTMSQDQREFLHIHSLFDHFIIWHIAKACEEKNDSPQVLCQSWIASVHRLSSW